MELDANKDYGLVNGVIRFGGKKIAWMTDEFYCAHDHAHTGGIVHMERIGYRIIIFLAALQGIDKGTIALHGWTGPGP